MTAQHSDNSLLMSAAGMMEFSRGIMKTSHDVFLAHGFHIPLVLMVMTRDPDTGKRIDGVQVHPVTIRPEDMPNGDIAPAIENKFEKFIRTLVRKSEAVGLVFVSETWVATASSRAEAMVWKGHLKEHPDRKEKLLVQVEHRRMAPQRQCWDAEIRRDPSGKVSGLGPWEVVPSEGLQALSDFLPKAD